jgi:autotransporter-associated beta strand protein
LNPISLSNAAGSRTVTVNDGGAAVDGVMAGVISSLTTANNGTRFVKNGLGTLALTAENTYVSGSFTGSTANNPLAFGTTISAGTLQLGNGGTTGSISALTGTAINSDVSIASGAFFAFNRSNGLTVANVITGAGAVTQRGTGTTTLTAANTYSGTTSVTNGTLLINNTTGSGTGTGAVTTSSGTTLGGTGTLSPGSGNGISVGGSLAPGDPAVNSGVGTLTFTPVSGDAIFSSTSTLDFQLLTQGLHGYSATYNLDGTLSTLTGSYVGGGNDRLIFNGGAAANKLDFSNLGTSNFNVTFGSGYTPAANDLFDLLDWTNLTGIGNGNLNNEASAIAGLTLAQLDLPTLSGGLLWDTSFWTSHGVIGIVVVPEPSRVLMLALGLSALIMRRRRW